MTKPTIADKKPMAVNLEPGEDITTWKKEMADLTGIAFAGVGPS